MARGGGKKKGKNKKGISIELEQEIISMKPSDLAIELTFEENAIEALKDQRKNELSGLNEQLREYDEALNNTKEVNDAKEKLAEAKAKNMDPDHIEAKENLSALKKGFAQDLKDRGAKAKFMRQTLKRHIESGALKRTK